MTLATGLVWYLYVVIGCSGWGCGVVNATPFPSYEACRDAAREVHFSSSVGQQVSGEDGDVSAAYCRLVRNGDGVNFPEAPTSWEIKP